ncbi:MULTISPECIES: selenocysteine-specific translation elongation factor [Mycobacterium]|uniref:Selenocysteine-specific elongation factor n=1 Tax=Mycobacterium kiyosense TaxID=2871094 RepID=A0A9P3Q907_9MYCO|nr:MULTISPECIES: selenocysteine-specific translation elongation factor [Mycobacterium]BDB39773.1 selenocysteine-specific translation elongation factor [Mycobacterium kiyosense]BDE11627.1 selenocysteine-specific translation elongation factor [Mycobacterium sp. 20KCMC460]GLB81905.1 selenocysteine-specific translation elongation factor [Mycobacterium kiyosense]GLB88135.1 selenocysteine-specific translation elongation factor [Mycobacterium kiyosense]GLB95695.1 selenocysteine-specific translation e
MVATAGHVDHGKSTLIRALTGMEPDRWEEERRRGLTIDLGFAWTTLPSGREVAFVDVPGHQRFLANTLAGLGPAPVVCFVVAADEGWQQQSSDHRDAIAALDIRYGLIVVTRADRAPERADGVLARTREELAETGLRDASGVVVSAVDGTGLADLRVALDRVLSEVPPPDAAARVRLWVDRAFTIAGAGTVVTGTLAAGTLTSGERLEMLGIQRKTSVAVRGLQSCGKPYPVLEPVSRAAVNLRGVPRDVVRRGDVLLTSDAWPITRAVDARRTTGCPWTEAPTQLVVHVGTAAVPGRLRPFGDDHGRLALDRRLPLVLGDRLVLRDPGTRRVLGGALVLDADPPALRRRGDSARRQQALALMSDSGDLAAEVARRGVVAVAHLSRLGLRTDAVPDGVTVLDGWWVDTGTYQAWQQRLAVAVKALHARDPLADGLSRGAARVSLGLPDEALLDALVRDAGLEQRAGHIRVPGAGADLGNAEAAVRELETRLRAEPFRAPEAYELRALGLGARALAVAERTGRILRLRDGVVLLPTAPALAMRELARLEQPFTTSQARQALGTTRRVAIPLLEHLDARGWTRRLDAGHREVVR